IHAAAPLAERQVVLQHVRLASPAAIARMARLRVAVTTQPSSYLWKAGASTLAAGGDPERVLPHRDLLAAGLPVVLATDNKPYRPLFTLWAAVPRLTREGDLLGPGQALGREEALRALTLDAACLCFEEDRRGSIEPGKLADLVVFARDPLSAP